MDKSMDRASAVARIAAHPVAQAGAAAALAATTGSALPAAAVALFQTLFASAAGTAIADNIAKCLDETNQEVAALSHEVAAMSAHQILVAHQALQEMLVSVDLSRLEILKRAAIGAIKDKELREDDAQLLVRLLRLVTAAEVDFTAKNFRYPRLYLIAPTFGKDVTPETLANIAEEGALALQGIVAEQRMVEGLVHCGLMRRSNDHAEAYEFTTICGRLLAVLGHP